MKVFLILCIFFINLYGASSDEPLILDEPQIMNIQCEICDFKRVFFVFPREESDISKIQSLLRTQAEKGGSSKVSYLPDTSATLASKFDDANTNFHDAFVVFLEKVLETDQTQEKLERLTTMYNISVARTIQKNTREIREIFAINE
ncbi:MAG: hypothetical protein WCJ92_07035 [Alphaproteobacteria bacterium]